jgi:hypothetical protein
MFFGEAGCALVEGEFPGNFHSKTFSVSQAAGLWATFSRPVGT